MGENYNTRYNWSYNTLDEQLKLKRVTAVKKTASDNLYAAFMMTKEDNKWTRIKDILSFSNKEQLTELDKEKIWHTLDNLQFLWMTKDVFKELNKEDFAKIKEKQTSTGRAEALIQLIIDKSWNSDKKDEILQRVNTSISAMNAEIGNNIAEKMALKKISANRFRHYWAKIRALIKANNWNISNCYMDIIKYANYASINLLKRTWTRYIVPVKFEWRNIPKQTQETLNALKERSKSSSNETEIFAINYIMKSLQKAFNCYKETIWPSNTEFDNSISDNTSNIYKVTFDKTDKRDSWYAYAA